MSNVNDILSSIYTGRFVAERARADHLARALSEVEEMVREMRPTEAVTIEGGNTADLADLEEIRAILDGANYATTPAGLRKALIDLRDKRDCLDAREAAVTEARQTCAAALGVSPNTSIGILSEDVAETMSALRRALGCPDGASAGQILAEVNRLRGTIEANNAEHERVKREQGRLWLEAQDSIAQRQCDNAALRAEIAALAGDLSILTAECARIDRAIAPLWTGDPSDCIGKRVEAVAKAAHVRAETVDSLYDKLRERDAQIAALTPGPWRTVAEEAPPAGEDVVVIGGAGRPYMCALEPGQSLDWIKLWRPLPAGLLDVPAPTVTP